MSIITTTEANDIMLEIVDLQAGLIRRLMAALGPFVSYENDTRQIKEKKMELEGRRGG